MSFAIKSAIKSAAARQMKKDAEADKEARLYRIGVRSWKKDVAPARAMTRSRITRPLTKAIEIVRGASGNVPWNFGNHSTPLAGHRYSESLEGRDDLPELIRAYRRASGWLRAIPEHPGLLSLFDRTSSQNGENSPYTRLDWIAIAFKAVDGNRWDGGLSPGRLYRKARAIQRKAQKIMGRNSDKKNGIAAWRAVPLAVKNPSNRRAGYILAAKKLGLHGAWYPGIEWNPEYTQAFEVNQDGPQGWQQDWTPDWEDLDAKIKTYRVARAVVALALARPEQTRAVIESSVFLPEWRPMAYRHLSRKLAHALLHGF